MKTRKLSIAVLIVALCAILGYGLGSLISDISNGMKKNKENGYIAPVEVQISNGYFIASAVIGNLLSFGAIFALNHFNVPV